MAAGLLPSDLDVEVVVAAPAGRRQDVVTGGAQLEQISIKGLEVEVAPCAANLPVVDGTHSCRDTSGHDETYRNELSTSSVKQTTAHLLFFQGSGTWRETCSQQTLPLLKEVRVNHMETQW